MILFAFGTRPEIIKILPILTLFEKENISYKLLYIKQHMDIIPELPKHEELEIYDISTNRLDNIILNVLDQIQNHLEGIDNILIQGDTETAFAIALAAFNRKIKLIHLEAGLRTFNKTSPYPEEMVRASISRMTDINLCINKNGAENLSREGIRTAKYIVGQTGLDLIDTSPLPENGTVLITLHRRENLPHIEEWFKEINKLAELYTRYTFIYPIHPNKEIRAHKDLLSNVKIIEPVEHKELIKMIKQSSIIISDSGGIQEEACYLHKKLVICRTVTERPECIWLNATLCKNPDYLSTAFEKISKKVLQDYVCPYGDGKSSEKVVEILKQEINK